MDSTGVRNVYVISDLHLGGAYSETPNGRGARINTHVSDLADFVDSLAAGPKTELVINGDMVDFLAETPWAAFTYDAGAACAKLQAIADRDSGFFRSLGAFLDKGHRLTILLGNHDIELALPAVRRKLREVIGVKLGHDYELISNGEAYQVGDALIEHGNRYDPWNMVGWGGLRKYSSLLSRRQIPENPEEYFVPPAGSGMVNEVINPIKQDYKFVDLLKPETDVAIPLLLSLEPGYRSILAKVAQFAVEAKPHQVKDAVPTIGDDISSAGDSGATDYGSEMSTYTGYTGESVGTAARAAAGNEDDPIAKILNAQLGADAQTFQQAIQAEGSGPAIGSDISTANFVDRTLGMAKLLLSRDDADVGRRLPALLMALQALEPDRSFDLDYETAPEYTTNAGTLLDGGFHYVLFGHTHMAKKIELRPGRWYLNSGTWCDLMQLPAAVMTAKPADARAALDPFVLDLSQGLLSRWIIFRPTYIRLALDASNKVVYADVLTYQRAATAAT